MGNDFGDNETEKRISKVFSKMHFITKKKDFSSTSYNTDLVKKVVKRFNEEVRFPLIKMLKEYYILKYNSKLEVDQSILNQLGFKLCSCCYQRFQEEGQVEIGGIIVLA